MIEFIAFFPLLRTPFIYNSKTVRDCLLYTKEPNRILFVKIRLLPCMLIFLMKILSVQKLPNSIYIL